LIQSVETIANEVYKSFKPEELEQIKTKENVVKLAKKFGLSDEQANQIALEACKSEHWITRKFKKFICDYADDSIWSEDDLFRSSIPSNFLPKKEDFEKTLSQIYAKRGKVTHEGQLYPTSARITGNPTVPARMMLEFGNRSQPFFPPVI